MNDAELTRAAVEASALPASRFARYIVGRDPRTITGWLAGHTIPPLARAWLACWLALPDATRREIVSALVPPAPRRGRPSKGLRG